MRLSYKYFTILLLLFSFSCGTVKGIFGNKDKESRSQENEYAERGSGNSESGVSGATYGNPIERYVATYAGIAQEEMRLYKIPASITLAQGILESGAGEGELTQKANNHFGIKCHGWEGGRVFHDDDRRQECFRKYKDAKYSFRDHSLFLTERKRYAKLFELSIDDYKGWARGLRAAGYATDRKYPEKLISIIERYELYRFDAEVMGKDTIAYESAGNSAERYIVQKGDTLYSIGKRHNLSVEQLKRYNNLRGSTIDIGQTLYLEPF